jgi:DNA-binding CsgD family transcriptional regulator
MKLATKARNLGMAEQSAKNHLLSLRRKVGAPHTAAVVDKLLRRGLA